tara:strand:- start:81 stop:551 length:471 start_codon:yes stop_codon:yes gene_type:complete
MERRENWEHFLSEFIFKRKDCPFEYGKNDCCLFVADAVEVMTGIDTAEDFRFQYKGKKEAYNLLYRFSGGYILETVRKLTKAYGMPEIKPGFASRGDVVLIDGLMGEALGIVDMSGTKIVVPGKKGLTAFPFEVIKKAWRVGYAASSRRSSCISHS